MPTFGMNMRSNGEAQYTIDGIGVTEETYKRVCKAHGVIDLSPKPVQPALNPVEHFYAVQHWCNPGPGAGHWYEVREIKASSLAHAKEKAFDTIFPTVNKRVVQK